MQCTPDFQVNLSPASQEGDSNSYKLRNDNLFVKAWFLIVPHATLSVPYFNVNDWDSWKCWSFSMDSLSYQ